VPPSAAVVRLRTRNLESAPRKTEPKRECDQSMSLVLQGTALNEEPMSRPLIGRFDPRGGTLGRSDSATFTLPDPERLISRIQAQVLYRDDDYWIENISAASPILHNGRSLSAGMRVMLRDGDELRIGGYTLLAAFENDEASATILRGRTGLTTVEGAQAALTLAPPSAVWAAGPAGTPIGAQSSAAQPGAQPPSRPADAPAAASADSLWREFLEGAGIAFNASAGPSPELLRTVGAMMRTAVEGIHRLVAMRATAKGEMHAEMTMIQIRDNNPLKFAPDAEVALKLLLQPPARGFLDGPSALRAAFIDLQWHEVGMMAGVRSALEAVLARFDPAKLETQLAAGSVFDSFRPTHRRARLWALYQEHYSSLRGEAQEEFQRFFGEAFREAYEAQVRSLDAADDPAPSAAPAGPRAGRRAR
jgi:predicted component of type VI protein secretion system